MENSTQTTSQRIEIRHHRHTAKVLFGGEYADLKHCVLAAIESGASLRGANLRGADLSCARLSNADLHGADLRGADLRYANLRRANLCYANLSDVDLSGAHLRGALLHGALLHGANLSCADLGDAFLCCADLSYADLSGANLRGASLIDADLSDADLSDAILTCANLRYANLRRASLRDADLTPIRDDVWAVLSSAPAGAAGVLTALREGRVDRSMDGLSPDISRPAERFFLAIKRGDTPATNQASAIAAEWVEQWIARMRAAFGAEGRSDDEGGPQR